MLEFITKKGVAVQGFFHSEPSTRKDILSIELTNSNKQVIDYFIFDQESSDYLMKCDVLEIANINRQVGDWYLHKKFMDSLKK